jgi:O-acetyl-ADP-ribose deacetylase (regulator of RNase III)
MIKYEVGNITDVKQGYIVHGVNCQRAMNSGVAKAIRDTYPKVYDDYMEYLKEYGDYDPLGTVNFVEVSQLLVVANAFTQNFYGKDGKRYVSYDAVEKCFSKINREIMSDPMQLYEDAGIFYHHIHIPKIGAGLGGGNWKIIESIINETMDPEIKITCWTLPSSA